MPSSYPTDGPRRQAARYIPAVPPAPDRGPTRAAGGSSLPSLLDQVIAASDQQAKKLLDRVIDETERPSTRLQNNPWARAWGMLPNERRIPAAARYLALYARLNPLLSAYQYAQLLAEALQDRDDEEGQSRFMMPAGGWRVVAKCSTGGSWDRVWAPSSNPMSNPVKNIINNCTVQTSFFYTGGVDSSLKSFGVVQAMPTGVFPDRGKAVVGFERDATGPTSQPGVQAERIERPSPDNKAKQRMRQLERMLPARSLDNPLGRPGGSYVRKAVVQALNSIQREMLQHVRETGPVRPVRRAMWHPGQVVIGGGPPRIEQSTHVWRGGQRSERKMKATSRIAAFIVMGAVTEFYDFVAALHDALPRNKRKSRTWRDATGNWHSRRLDSMLRDIRDNYEHLDLPKAMVGVVLNQIEDYVIGRVNRQVNTGSQSISGIGTDLNRAQGAGSLQNSEEASVSELIGSGSFNGLSAIKQWIMSELFAEPPSVFRYGTGGSAGVKLSPPFEFTPGWHGVIRYQPGYGRDAGQRGRGAIVFGDGPI